MGLDHINIIKNECVYSYVTFNGCGFGNSVKFYRNLRYPGIGDRQTENGTP